MKHLSLAVWQTGLIASVQTCGELGSRTDDAALEAGAGPSMPPFAIVRVGWPGVLRLAERGFRASPIGKTGVLLEG